MEETVLAGENHFPVHQPHEAEVDDAPRVSIGTELFLFSLHKYQVNFNVDEICTSTPT